DLLGAGVLKLGDGLEHELPLGRDAIAAGPQLLVPRLRHGPETRACRPIFRPLGTAWIRRICRQQRPGLGPVAAGAGRVPARVPRAQAARAITRLPLPAYLT